MSLFKRIVWCAVAIVAAIGASGCGGASPTLPSGAPSAALRVTPGTWAVLGASTTAGFSASTPSQAWVARLQSAVASSGVTMVNLAVPGAVTYNWMSLSAPVPPGKQTPMAQNNIDAAMALQPKLLLINATNNDLAVGYSPDETVANLLAIRSVAVAGGAGHDVIFQRVDAALQSGRCVAAPR